MESLRPRIRDFGDKADTVWKCMTEKKFRIKLHEAKISDILAQELDAEVLLSCFDYRRDEGTALDNGMERPSLSSKEPFVPRNV